MRLTIALLSATGLYGQAGRDPQQLLQTVRAKLQADTAHLANYACIQTIDRSYFQRAPGREELIVESTDRLRLEVAISQGAELHSWPGATRFDARSLDQIISGGPIGAGAFATYLTDIFDN